LSKIQKNAQWAPKKVQKKFFYLFKYSNINFYYFCVVKSKLDLSIKNEIKMGKKFMTVVLLLTLCLPSISLMAQMDLNDHVQDSIGSKRKGISVGNLFRGRGSSGSYGSNNNGYSSSPNYSISNPGGGTSTGIAIQNNNTMDAIAPIGNGMFILLAAGIGYAASKSKRKDEKE